MNIIAKLYKTIKNRHVTPQNTECVHVGSYYIKTTILNGNLLSTNEYKGLLIMEREAKTDWKELVRDYIK